MVREFAGIIRRILGGYWTQRDSVGKDPTESVKPYLLEETLVFPWQFDAIKAELADYRRPGKKLIYAFQPFDSARVHDLPK